ncbi:MAG: hypothetical protein WAK11_02620, partial [Candidatus Cybelea sp.]
AKNWLTRVRMEVGRRSREGREQENNDGRHVGLDKKPSLMEVSPAKVYSRYEALNRVSMHRAWSMRVEIAVKSVITAAVTSTPPSGLRAVCPLAALFLPLAG